MIDLIFHGDRNSGRSSILFALADICQSNGEICYFFGATDEFNTKDSQIIYSMQNPFTRRFFYRHTDHRLTENIVELSNKEKCNYIFLDDVDFINKKDLEILNKSTAVKIATSLTNRISDFKYSKLYEVYSKYDDSQFREEKYLKSNEEKILITDFFKMFERDKKINSILK